MLFYAELLANGSVRLLEPEEGKYVLSSFTDVVGESWLSRILWVMACSGLKKNGVPQYTTQEIEGKTIYQESCAELFVHGCIVITDVSLIELYWKGFDLPDFMQFAADTLHSYLSPPPPTSPREITPNLAPLTTDNLEKVEADAARETGPSLLHQYLTTARSHELEVLLPPAAPSSIHQRRGIS